MIKKRGDGHSGPYTKAMKDEASLDTSLDSFGTESVGDLALPGDILPEKFVCHSRG